VKFDNEKILILSAHTDDMEVSCAGTVSRIMRDTNRECKMFSVAFSPALESLPKGFSQDSTNIEFKESMLFQGITNSLLYKYEVRKFPSFRQEILENIVEIRKQFLPTIIFTHSRFDIHQDHQTIYEETVRAFKGRDVTILGYELLENCLSFNSNFFIEIEKEDLEKKINSFKIYKSQIVKGKNLNSVVESLAVVRGSQIRKEYAECFDCIKMKI